ncbi:hypothetical protein [Treponema socranskii]|uniref:hypothetical protein n=1 Tax=Treponema socranskii TaxID=53419 RepID=UPI003D6EA79A
MGLLSLVSGGEAKKTSGLLAAAAPLAQRTSYASFSDLCGAFDIGHGAVFEITDDSFVMSACTGLDAASVALSVSSSDFWDGTIGTNSSVKSFSKPAGNLTAFYQLFSPRIRERLSCLHFFRLSSDAIFMKADFTGETSVPPPEAIKIPLEKFIKNGNAGDERSDNESLASVHASLLQEKNATLFLLSTKIAINRILISYAPKSEPIKDRLFSAIYTDAADTLERSFGAPNVCRRGKNGELHIVLFCRADFDEAVLQFHISRALTPLLDKAAESLMLIKAGTAHTAEDIERFTAEG